MGRKPQSPENWFRTFAARQRARINRVGDAAYERVRRECRSPRLGETLRDMEAQKVIGNACHSMGARKPDMDHSR